jgi:hypothetical protein
MQREQLEADVLIVGAGPAGLACALQLANLIKKHNASGGKPELSAENIYVLEKGRELGAHQLSGAIMNPRALRELVPDFEKSAPLDTRVTDSAALIFTEKSTFRIPITPPPFNNTGNYVISLSKLVKWMGGLVEAAGVNVFKEFAGAELIYEGNGVAGVITEDKGVDKNGKPKDNYTPGYELREGDGAGGRNARVADKKAGRQTAARQHQSPNVRDRDQRVVGSASGKNQARLRGTHAGLAYFDEDVWRWLDLRIAGKSRIHRAGDCAGVLRLSVRSPRRVSNLEDASLPEQDAGRREVGAVRREIAALWRLVRHAA